MDLHQKILRHNVKIVDKLCYHVWDRDIVKVCINESARMNHFQISSLFIFKCNVGNIIANMTKANYCFSDGVISIY